MTRTPWRNVGVTTPCPICGQPFIPVGRQQVCSPACRQAAWRRRHAPAPVPLSARSPRTATIYECPSCDTRYLGVQRCPDCGTFCHKLGPGGACPHCDEPVLLADLLDPILTPGGAPH
jgi:hypothetical protein